VTRSYDIEIARLVVTGITSLPADADGVRVALARELARVLAPRPDGAELAAGATLRIELPALSFAAGDDRGAVTAVADGVARALGMRPAAGPSTGDSGRG
jgi:hypothetical protein